nr:septum formation initiator family protein [Merdimmobilis hominis]
MYNKTVQICSGKDVRSVAKGKKNKKSFIFKVAFLAFTCYVAVSFTLIQIDIANKEKQLADAKTQLAEQKLIKSEIIDVLNSGENTEYIAKIAREKLGMAYPDEEVFVDPNRKE